MDLEASTDSKAETIRPFPGCVLRRNATEIGLSDPLLLDHAMRDINGFIQAGTWGGVHIWMALHKTTFAASKRADVMEFLADLKPRLQAARARSKAEGWCGHDEGNVLWVKGPL